MQLVAAEPRPLVTTAAPRDLRRLGQIWLEMMREHERRDSQFALAPDGLERWTAMATEMLARDDAFLYCAHRDGRAVGFCLGWIAHNPAIYAISRVGFVSEVAVTASARRTGVGTALVATARRWFAAQGLGEFQLSTAIWNEGAQRFWAAVGGEPLLLRYRFGV